MLLLLFCLVLPVTFGDDCELPSPPQYGEWFCPPSADSVVCSLECFPGYVPEGDPIITCTDGTWTSSPSCIEAIGLITGSYTDYAGRDHTRDVEVYGQGVHEGLPQLPEARRGHTLDYVDSKIILCGGYDKPMEIISRSCIIFTESKQWISHSTTTLPRDFHGSVVLLNQLHLLGGRGWDSRISTEFLVPLATGSVWTKGWDLLELTADACTTKTGPQTFISTGGTYLESAISYNSYSGAATRLMDLTTPRKNHGCAYVRDPQTQYTGVIVAGGQTAGYTRLSDSEIYDFEKGTWSKTGQLTTERADMSMAVLGESILAFGGYEIAPRPIPLSTVDRFNLTTLEWSATENMMNGKTGFAVTGVPPSLVIGN